MRVLVQRVSQAAVTVDGQTSGEIGAGALLLVGIEEADGPDDIGWLVRKISQLRIFNDEAVLTSK
ncbi:D-aminoacyl-tRNA deacylase [Chromobacterium violaceum]|uniref:D-aminoacyl-tRNA deacylase n=1 Tax=Chromobacterium violaceum TaxID=536 RepID=UPI002174E251|nr:D-aminoacyl-tRNA deacylase [Chromobacterium violaceum]